MKNSNDYLYKYLNLRDLFVVTVVFGFGLFVSILLLYTSLNRYTDEQEVIQRASLRQFLNSYNSLLTQHTLGLKHLVNSTSSMENEHLAPITFLVNRFLEGSKFKALAIVHIQEQKDKDHPNVQLVKSESSIEWLDLDEYIAISRIFFDRNILIENKSLNIFVRPNSNVEPYLVIAIPSVEKDGLVFLGFISMNSIIPSVHFPLSMTTIFDVVNLSSGVELMQHRLDFKKDKYFYEADVSHLNSLQPVTIKKNLDKDGIFNFYVNNFETIGWPWLIFISSLVFTIFITFWIFGLLRRGVEVRELVKKRTFELEEEKRKAEEANSAKTRFLANVSHEVRTPLNIIIGMTDLMSETNLEDFQRSHLKTIARSSFHLLSLIEDILDINRVEVNELQINLEKFSINKLVNDVVRFVSTPIRSKKIRFHYYLDPNFPEYLVGDPRKIKQIILNLVNNSIKFTDKGSITLEFLLSEPLNENDKSVSLRILVKDTGIGISTKDQDKVFKSFVQLDPTSTRSRGGVGLGLAIVETYISKMNGKISMVSNPGEGTSIFVDLKLPFETASPWSEKYDLKDTLTNKKVYILSSSEVEFKNISEALKRFGAVTVHEKSGLNFSKNFCEVMKNNDYFIIDSDMLEVGGIEVLGSNKEHLKNHDCIIVLLHQKHRKDDIQILKNLGISRICFKPLIFDEFFKAIKFNEKYETQFHTKNNVVNYEISRNSSVLVAEDDPDNRNLIEAFLKPLNLNLTFANDGLEALEKFKVIRPEIVITDIQMPRMDGFSFLKAAQEYQVINQIGRDSYFIVLTADAIPEQLSEAKRLGARKYLTKPIQKKDFVEMIIKANDDLIKERARNFNII